MKKLLKKIWTGWKKIAHTIGRVQTVIILTLFYFLILAPLGALFRLFGWDPLVTGGFNSSKKSNWQEVGIKSPDLESLKRQS
jgi:hypothetical protein